MNKLINKVKSHLKNQINQLKIYYNHNLIKIFNSKIKQINIKNNNHLKHQFNNLLHNNKLNNTKKPLTQTFKTF